MVESVKMIYETHSMLAKCQFVFAGFNVILKLSTFSSLQINNFPISGVENTELISIWG